MPLVSVIMPTYNSAEHLRRSIDSVVEQDFDDWELIVVDDASSDESAEIVRSYDDPRITGYKRDQNGGPAKTRNEAIERSTGRFITFLDSDDQWHRAKLATQLEWMARTDAAFSCSGYNIVDEQGNRLGARTVPQSVSYEDLLLSRAVIGCLTAMYDREKCGTQYMPEIRKRQDLGLWLRLTNQFGPAVGIPEALAEYCVRSNSVSSNKFSAALYTWRLFRDIESMPLLKSINYFARYAKSRLLR